MKKSTIWTIVIVVLIALGGGIFLASKSADNSKATAYEQAISQGKDDVQNKNYAQAAKQFKKAYNLKNTQQAQSYSQQAQNMSLAVADAKDGAYHDALTATQKVIDQDNGYSRLKTNAQKLHATLSEVKDNYTREIKPLFSNAAQAENKQEYKQAVTIYQDILDLPYINERYYTKYHDRAKRALKRNQQLASQDKTTAQDNHHDTDSSASSTSSPESSGEGAPGNHTVHGKDVTTGELGKIKKRVNKAGYNAQAWSPQDLIDLYRESGKNSPSKITKKDITNYLKK